MTRPEHLLASGLIAAEVDEILNALAMVIRPVPFQFLWRPKLKDPGDEMVLDTAVNGEADLLVTFNVRDLGIRVVKPGEAWKALGRDETK